MGYIPGNTGDVLKMMESIGIENLEQLYADVPEGVKLARPLALNGGDGEMAATRHIQGIAQKNKIYRDIFLGAGAYRHFIPAAVDNIASRNEFVTAYTPYQAELNQGVLQSIFEYQTMICELTGMDVSNASVYDGATAAGEACLMARGREKNVVVVSAAAHPQAIEVIQAYCEPAGMEVVLAAHSGGRPDAGGTLAFWSAEPPPYTYRSPIIFGK
jgi:glycine dehydrogenase subunit 1